MAAGCERLVHPSVNDETTRARHARLVAVTLAAPFFAAGAAGQVFLGQFGAAVTLAALCAIFGAFWLAAVVVASTGRDGPIGVAVLAFSTLLGAIIVASSGGIASPLALVVAALVVEPAWIRRTRSALLLGLAAASAALLLQPVLGSMAIMGPSAVSAWHWLIPLAYMGSVALRAANLLPASGSSGEEVGPVRLEDALDAVVIRIAKTGEIVDASAKARDILRLAPELLLGSGFFDRIHVADRIGYLCALADMREGAALRRVELRLRLPSETAMETVDNYRPFSAELVSVGTDRAIVAVVRANGEIAALRDALAVADDTAASVELAKSRFLAAVSHELRTPLNAIIGFSDMLTHEMCGKFANPRQKEYIGLIKDSGNHLLAVVNSILDVSKIESGAYAIHCEPFRFGDAVAMCHSMMSFQAEAKEIAFATEIGQGVGEINGDRRGVQQMLINLVSNAIKFTPHGGSVTIGAKRIGSRLHFWVEDSGIGISEEDLARLGRPFMQVQNDYTRQFEGTGLGLSLVKGLVALHEGTMTMESAPGKGTTVTISLPVAGPTDGTDERKQIAIAIAAGNEGTDGTLRKTA